MYKNIPAFWMPFFLHFGAVFFTPNWKYFLSEECEKLKWCRISRHHLLLFIKQAFRIFRTSRHWDGSLYRQTFVVSSPFAAHRPWQCHSYISSSATGSPHDTDNTDNMDYSAYEFYFLWNHVLKAKFHFYNKLYNSLSALSVSSVEVNLPHDDIRHC